MPTINIIDPGHDAVLDPGAIARYVKAGQKALAIIKEAELNIRLATRLYDIIANYQQTALTRRWDTRQEVKLSSRIWTAENYIYGKQYSKTVRFISIHCNNYNKAEVNGLEIFYQAAIPESKALAGAIYENILYYAGKAGYVYHGRGLKTAPFYVLRNAPCPAILIECGFMSNPIELEWLMSPTAQITLPYAIGKTLLDI